MMDRFLAWLIGTLLVVASVLVQDVVGQPLTAAGTGSGVSALKLLSYVSPLNEVNTLSVSPANIREGTTATGTVTLPTLPRPPLATSGVHVALTSSSANVTVPAQVTVAAGATAATFPVTARAPGPATITAKGIGGTVEKRATVVVVALQVRSLSFPSNVIRPGTSATGTVTLDGEAPAGGVKVSLTSSNLAVTVPAEVTVLARSAAATFTATAAPSAAEGAATITASRSAGGAAGSLVAMGLSVARPVTATLSIKRR